MNTDTRVVLDDQGTTSSLSAEALAALGLDDRSCVVRASARPGDPKPSSGDPKPGGAQTPGDPKPGGARPGDPKPGARPGDPKPLGGDPKPR